MRLVSLDVGVTIRSLLFIGLVLFWSINLSNKPSMKWSVAYHSQAISSLIAKWLGGRKDEIPQEVVDCVLNQVKGDCQLSLGQDDHYGPQIR